MDALIEAMSDKDLLGMKTKHAGNDTVTALIDGIIAERKAKVEQAEAQARFEDGISKLFADLPHPESIANIYVRWAEADVPDGAPEQVTVDGKTEMRQPTKKLFKWVVETNKGFKSITGSGVTTAPRKRGITVSKRDATNPAQLVLVGHFPSASKACDHLKLIVAGDSAVRVIQREGMFIEPYDGTEYTSS